MKEINLLKKELLQYEEQRRNAIDKSSLLMNSISWATLTAFVLCNSSVMAIILNNLVTKIILIILILLFSASIVLSLLSNMFEVEIANLDADGCFDPFFVKKIPILAKIDKVSLPQEKTIEIKDKYEKLSKNIFNRIMDKKNEKAKIHKKLRKASFIIWGIGFILFVSLMIFYISTYSFCPVEF